MRKEFYDPKIDRVRLLIKALNSRLTVIWNVPIRSFSDRFSYSLRFFCCSYTVRFARGSNLASEGFCQWSRFEKTCFELICFLIES